MFNQENVELYLMDSYPEVDGEKRTIKMRCYLNPASYDDCAEVDGEIAKILFHTVGNERMPRSIATSVRFGSLNIPPQSMTFCRDPKHANYHVHIPAVNISKIEAGKVTPESNDWALMFTVSFEKNDPKVLNDLADLLHEKFFATFAKLQPSLFDKNADPVMELVCRLCEAPNPEFATTDGKFAYCAKCSVNSQEGEVLRRIRDHAAAAVAAHSADEDGRQHEEEPGPPRADPLASDGDFNARNRAGRRRRS